MEMRIKSEARMSIRHLVIAVVACLALAPALPLLAASPQEEANQRLVERFVEEVLSPGRHDRLEQFLEPEAAAKFRKAERLRRSLFPDLTYEVQDLVADGDRVVVRYRLTGTHTGDKPGLPPGQSAIPPTHHHLEVEEVALYTVAGGKLTQQWLLSDRLPVAQALGYTVSPPPGSTEGGSTEGGSAEGDGAD